MSATNAASIGTTIQVPGEMPKRSAAPEPKAKKKASDRSKAKKEAKDKAPARRTLSHTVRRNDNLISLARYYDTSWGSIMKANRLADPHRITVGQKLQVPVPASFRGDGDQAAPGGGGRTARGVVARSTICGTERTRLRGGVRRTLAGRVGPRALRRRTVRLRAAHRGRALLATVRHLEGTRLVGARGRHRTRVRHRRDRPGDVVAPVGRPRRPLCGGLLRPTLPAERRPRVRGRVGGTVGIGRVVVVRHRHSFVCIVVAKLFRRCPALCFAQSSHRR